MLCDKQLIIKYVRNKQQRKKNYFVIMNVLHVQCSCSHIHADLYTLQE